MVKDNKHEFAFFCSDLSLQKSGETLLIDNVLLVRRITNILRLKPDDRLIVFNQEIHMQVQLKHCSKKSCSFLVESGNKNKILKPKITVLLPILKRDALETALYSCVALGASKVQLITTEKMRKWQGEKELERLQRITVSAAEQSKHFAFPTLKSPLSLVDALEHYKTTTYKLFADPEGVSCLKNMSTLNGEKDFLVMVGPEGDLATGEKELLKKDFIFVALVPTILKSEQALALLLGVTRMAT